MQFEIEVAKAQHQAKSGLVLDLRKCFNCTRWTFGYAMLQKLGLPPFLLRQWFLSLQVLSRCWIINGESWPAGHVTCGFPEGDTLSVLVMIGVSLAWIFFVAHHLRGRTVVALTAYADNWGWHLNDAFGHELAMTATLDLLDTAGLQIDWTWYWSTRNHDAATIASLLQPVANHSIKRVSTANGLGLQMQYSGQKSRGLQKGRIDVGCARLDRLAAMPHALAIKERMVRTSI